jgi:hypothetical protein
LINIYKNMKNLNDKLKNIDHRLGLIDGILKKAKSIGKEFLFLAGVSIFPVKYVFFDNHNSNPPTVVTNNVPYLINTNYPILTNYQMYQYVPQEQYIPPDQYSFNINYHFNNIYEFSITVLAMIMLFVIAIKIINLFGKK